jgi:hypothetical protein
MFIDKTYFQGELNIPSLQAQSPVLNSLNLFIQEREPMYLRSALGYSLWKLFIAGLAEAVPDARWTDLKNGADYTDGNGILRRWEGFTNSVKQSPIAGYVYYWFVRDAATYTSSSGEVESKKENATNISPSMKSVRAYNDMVKQTAILHDYLTYAVDGNGDPLYPEYNPEAVECFKTINIFNV